MGLEFIIINRGHRGEMKNEQEIEYEQMVMTMDKEFQILEDKKTDARVTEARVQDINQRMKKLAQILKRVEENLKSSMRKKNENEYDISNRLRNHKLTYEKMQNRFKALQNQAFLAQKQDLMKHKNMTDIQLDDFKRAQDHLMRVNGLDRDANEVHGIVTDTYAELHGQGLKLKDIENDAEGFDHDLSLNDQLLRVIANRQLKSKLILVLLVVFLGFADLMLLVIKLL